ncbi:UNVERIFIED_CONTAM: hypothetical protein PYX00_008366 [Menopon gallinae]|uniref:Ionotropic receptor 75a N-terminal domain-containing protein n=1 Tax=Menopon gallinae TaxID=328185 RepID=A0AAW2HP38_9NEOP
MKEASTNFQCLITVNPPDRPVSKWFVTTQLQLFVVDLACPDTRERLKEADGMGLFNGNYIWLVFDSAKENNGTKLVSYRNTAVSAFEDLYVTANSQVNIATEMAGDRFELTGLYKRYAMGKMIPEKLGYWTKDDGLVFTAEKSPFLRRQNLQGHTFNATMVITNDRSLKLLRDLGDPTTDTVSKVYFAFIELTIEAMNATAHYLISRKWGERINGSYDGMLGYVQRGEADLLASPVIMSAVRLEILQYVAYGLKIRLPFIFLSPQLSYNNNVYLLPFGMDVWYCTLALFVSFVIILRFIAVYEEGIIDDVPITAVKKPVSKSWSDVIMMNIGTICQQDIYMEPKSAGGRVVLLQMKITILFLMVSYSAAILVLLQTPDRSIKDLMSLYKSNLKLGVHNTPYNRFYFTHPDTPVRKLVATKITKEEDYMTAEVGIQKVRPGFFAFNIDTVVGYTLIRQMLDESEKCRLQALEESMIPNNDAMIAVKKNFPFAELTMIMNRKLHERGLITREARRRTATKPICLERPMTYISIAPIDCEAAFVFLGYGMTLSVIIFIVEVFVGRKKHKAKGINITTFRRVTTPHFEYID